jgi:hypothetical protein
MSASTMSTALVPRRVVAGTATARKARAVTVRAHAAPPDPRHRARRSTSSASSLYPPNRRALTSPSPPAVQVRAAAKPTVIGKAAELRLIGKAVTAAEELGLLGIADSISLSDIERAGLLSKGEALIYDRGAPNTIAALGFVLAAAGSAAVYFIPDDSAGLVAAQAALGVAAALGFGASIAGSSLLRKLQN